MFSLSRSCLQRHQQESDIGHRARRLPGSEIPHVAVSGEQNRSGAEVGDGSWVHPYFAGGVYQGFVLPYTRVARW